MAVCRDSTLQMMMWSGGWQALKVNPDKRRSAVISHHQILGMNKVGWQFFLSASCQSCYCHRQANKLRKVNEKMTYRNTLWDLQVSVHSVVAPEKEIREKELDSRFKLN